ncbi:MAG: transposase [bacterium]
MNSSASAIRTAQNESIWRERIVRQAASGRSVVAFCRDENVAESTLYYWRKRLGAAVAARPAQKSTAVAIPFLDLGPIKAVKPAESAGIERLPYESAAGIELRLELGGGVVLHIARH